MTKTMKWTLALTASLATAGLLFAVPALAQETGFSPRGMMTVAGRTSAAQPYRSMMWGGGMYGMMGGDMAAMHNAMLPLMSQMPAMYDQIMGEVAQLLGMTPDELNDALADGSSLADLAAEKGLSLDEVQKVMSDGMKAFVDQAVADGTLTREQADQMLQYHEQYSGSCHSGQSGRMMGGMRRMMFAPNSW